MTRPGIEPPISRAIGENSNLYFNISDTAYTFK